jgi:cytochrome b6-f complex iron-sulfur subunit
MNRKQFLKTVAATVVGTPLLGMLKGCAPSAPIIYARLTEDKAVLPASLLSQLDAPGSYIKVYIPAHAHPLLLFQQEDGELTAVLSTCSHSGCEVRKVGTKFECPCHGSEYDLQGNVLRGPAPEPLERFRVVTSGAFLHILFRG